MDACLPWRTYKHPQKTTRSQKSSFTQHNHHSIFSYLYHHFHTESSFSILSLSFLSLSLHLTYYNLSPSLIMRRAQLVPLLFSGVAVAAPRPQDIPFDLAIAAPDPTYTISVGAVSQSVVYDTASIISEATAVSSMTVAVTDVVSSAIATATDPVSTLARRADCAALPKVTNDAPAYSPDAASAFLAQTAFAATASAAPTPSGYDVAFIGMNASSQAYGYLGFINLPTYGIPGSKIDRTVFIVVC